MYLVAKVYRREVRAPIMGPLKRSTLLILNAIAVLSYLFVGWAAGSIGHVDASVFSSQDSREYREYADWIFGARPSSVASNWRPFLYPLLLGLAERIGGVRGVWILNVAVWFTALNFCAARARDQPLADDAHLPGID
jgi:hypothetical protein